VRERLLEELAVQRCAAAAWRHAAVTRVQELEEALLLLGFEVRVGDSRRVCRGRQRRAPCAASRELLRLHLALRCLLQSTR